MYSILFNFYLGTYSSFAAKLANVKAIFTNFGANYINSSVLKILYKIIDPVIDIHICNSLSGKNTLLDEMRFKKDKVFLIKNGIDTKRLDTNTLFKNPFSSFLGNKKIIGCVSNLLPDKDPFNFLKVAQIVAKKNKNVFFVLVGSGPYENKIKDYYLKNDMEKYFKLFTNRDDGPYISKYFDICLLTSRREAFPNVLLEYMYWGKPCVVTNVGDCANIVEHNKTGKVVNSGSPEEIANAIQFFLDNKQISIEMGKNGRKKLLKIIQLIYIRKLLNKYESILSSNDQEF